MLNFPHPTAQELGNQVIDLYALFAKSPREEFRSILKKICAAHREKLQLPLSEISFFCLEADPEISRLEERPGMNHLISRIQMCFVLEAYDLLCEQQGIPREAVRKQAQHSTGPIVRGLWKELYGKR